MSDQAIYRHTLTVRITHWVNVLCLTVLLMSGLQIFNAHPALYIGKQSDFDHRQL
jgi:cytochrome b subunit of formate dehydrogenase